MNVCQVPRVRGWRLNFLAMLSILVFSLPGHSATPEGEEDDYPRQSVSYNYVEIKVKMDKDGCPENTEPSHVIPGTSKARVKRGTGVQWVREDGENIDFEIYFNPFAIAAAGLVHTPTKIWTVPIPDKTPNKGGVTYKYTIAKESCPPLDPHLVVVE
jgi:hypothetical protein